MCVCGERGEGAKVPPSPSPYVVPVSAILTRRKNKHNHFRDSFKSGLLLEARLAAELTGIFNFLNIMKLIWETLYFGHGRSTLLRKFQIFQKMAILTLHYFVQKSFRQPVEDPKVCFAILYIKVHLIYKILKLRILWKWKWCKAYLASFDFSMLLSRGFFGQSLHSLDQI